MQTQIRPRRTLLHYLALASVFVPAAAQAAPTDALKTKFVTPPDNARPWVYWYFMDGNLSKEGMKADLEAMKKAGIGGGIYLEVGIGVPRGPVEFMSPEWQDHIKFAVMESQRQGFSLALGTGPGWTGSGGPWVKTEQSMQHLVASETTVTGPTQFNAALPQPKPRGPFFGEYTLNEGPELHKKWAEYYQDEYVLAFPTPKKGARLEDIDKKALYYRAPYTGDKSTPRIPAMANYPAVPAGESIDQSKIINLTGKLNADGRLNWDVPPGEWTIMRFGRTATGQTTRPAPAPGIGFESDKFSQEAVAAHMNAYTGALLKTIGPNFRKGDTGLTMLHFDSWEMSSQNWTQAFKTEFIKRRGYDPTPYLPAMTGYIVGDRERSERFLWDLRQTSNELVLENHAGFLKKYAHDRKLGFSVEPYDMNPTSDLDLGGLADLPMCEFWSWDKGLPSEYSCFDSISAAHTNGRNIIGAEAFTAVESDAWLQHPGSMKNQLDWALATGINKFVIHRYQHQPKPGQLPGMAMGPYGVHWEATQTWWDMVGPFHQYMARTSEMLRQGAPVADVLYLAPEGAPQVFTPPPTAVMGDREDRRGYNFDGCSPTTLLAHATVKDGRIQLPGGASYKLLALPNWELMTPELLGKIVKLVEAGATVIGAPPQKSPSLVNYPSSDNEVKTLATRLWGNAPYAPQRKVGKGQVFYYGSKTASRLPNARWIWEPGGNPAGGVNPGTIYVSKTIEIDPSRTITSALANFTADNSYAVTINGTLAVTGDNYHFTNETEVAKLLKPGRNEVRVTATNGGTNSNPAGLIGNISLTFADGTKQEFNTDSSWSVAKTEGGTTSPAMELGGSSMGPWGQVNNTPSIYPSYTVTSQLLSGQGLAPDFASEQPMRYIHRRLKDGELYFVANIEEVPITTTATFRVAGKQPEWWNAVTGESRVLTDYKVENGLTTIPVKLAGSESGFVIFRKPIQKNAVATPNFTTWNTMQTLSQPWNVKFDIKWGAPETVTFNQLEDWSKSTNDAIKYHSGTATYKTTFDAPADGGKYALGLGTVKNIASVKINGRDLGIVWCDPWQATIPAGLLKPTGNELEVRVANLWSNRLIGDAKLPEAQRKTETTFRPYNADSALQPSGLLGPVTLEKASN